MLIKIDKNDPIIDNILFGDDSIIFHIIDKIRFSSNDSKLYTDLNSCIIAIYDSFHPVWIYLKEEPSINLKDELSAFLTSLLNENPDLSIISNDRLNSSLVNIGIDYTVLKELNSYVLSNSKSFISDGYVRKLDELNFDILDLLYQYSEECDSGYTKEVLMNKIIETSSNKTAFGLYNDSNKLVSIAIIEGTECKRMINNIITRREYRENGYAKHLISYLTNKYGTNDFVIMLYTDSSDEIANTFVRDMGFSKIGNLQYIKFRRYDG